MKQLLFFTLSIALGYLMACTQTPTKGESHRIFSPEDLQKKVASPLKITPSTVLVDARVAFQYELAHVPGSINMHWEDFSQADSKHSGLLKTDLQGLAKRLSLLGIDINTSVIVIGNSQEGHGEEGRLAWTFFYLGIKDVQFVGIQHFKQNLTQQETLPLRNVTPWIPNPQESVLISKKEFMAQAFPPGKSRSPHLHIVDVRSQKEYFEPSGRPDLTAINIDWREFLDTDGRVHLAIARQLQSVGIQKEHAIFVISNHGVRSALVTMALSSLGYAHVSNFAGGYDELIKR